MRATIYHNPRCTKSRETLALLQASGIECDIVLYLETPPDAAALTRLLQLLGRTHARTILRTGEAEYAELGLHDLNLDSSQLIAAMAAHPRLIERPIVVIGERAAIGRPPENVLALLG